MLQFFTLLNILKITIAMNYDSLEKHKMQVLVLEF